MSDTTGGTQSGPAGWHADPFGRYELRYYDGAQWTEHVSTQGNQYVDQPVYAADPEPAAAAPAAAQPVAEQPVAADPAATAPTDAHVAQAVTASAEVAAAEEPVPAEIVDVTPAPEPVVIGPPVINLASVVINVVDYAREKAFWQAVLGVEIAQEFDGAFIWFKPQAPGGISVALQQVDYPTHGRNRVHLDSGVADLATAQAQIEVLGGRLVEDQEMAGFQWKVMADPEDNEFCIALQSVEDHMH
jgi:predicted enzyme related to lactoylglutathione lyase